MNKGKVTKEKILQVANDFAKANGLSSISIREIAKACGVAVGSIYNYYPSKGEIILDIVEGFWANAFASVDFSYLKDKDFFTCYRYLYQILSDYLETFEDDWLEQLSQLDSSLKKQAKMREQKYQGKIQEYLMTLIHQHHEDALRRGMFTYDPNRFLAFIFDNTLSMLKNKEKNPDFFLSLLHKILE